MRQYGTFVFFAGKFFYFIGVVGQGAKVVVDLCHPTVRIVLKPDAIFCRGASVGIAGMGYPRRRGVGHTVFIGYQHMLFSCSVRSDAERHIRQMLHGAAFCLGEGQVASNYLLFKGKGRPGADVFFCSFAGQRHFPGLIAAEIPSRRLYLFYENGS